MSSANVKDIQALEALRSALLKFKSDADGSLYAMQAECKRTIEWMQERQRYWQRERQRRIESLQQARAALAYCLGGDGDCSWEMSMVQRAQQALAEAEQRLQIVQLHLKQVNNAFGEFEREARRLTNIFGNELQQGIALLSRNFGTLSTYASGVASSAGSTGHSGVTVPALGGTALGEPNFASEKKLAGHFKDHVIDQKEFVDISQNEYLQGAQNLMHGGEGIDQFTRPNGEIMYYNYSTNEFGVKTSGGIIKTYFKPIDGIDYWLDQISKYSGKS